MEEFVLHLLLAGNELHVVHEQKVGVAVLGAELAAAAGAHELDEFVDEIVALDVDDLGRGACGADLVGDGVDEVRFSKAGVTVDEEGVIVVARPVRHGAGGGIGHFVGFAHNEGLKGEFAGIEQRSGFFFFWGEQRRALSAR